MNNVSKGITSNIRTTYVNSTGITAATGGATGGFNGKSGDGVAMTGATIDTQFTATGIGGQSQDLVGRFGSVKFAVFYDCVLTATKNLSIAAEYQTSTDGSSWATAVSLRAAAAVATATGVNSGQLEYDLSLESLPRYIRFNVTPDLSATGTDTAIIQTVAILTDATVNPISRA